MVDLGQFNEERYTPPPGSDAAPAPSRDDLPEALPAGTYPVKIVNSRMVRTEAGTGEYLELTFMVSTRGFAGRIILDRLNFINLSEYARDQAHHTLRKIWRIVGIPVLSNSSDLHNWPMQVKVNRITLNSGHIVNNILSYAHADQTPGQPGFAPAGETVAPE